MQRGRPCCCVAQGLRGDLGWLVEAGVVGGAEQFPRDFFIRVRHGEDVGAFIACQSGEELGGDAKQARGLPQQRDGAGLGVDIEGCDAADFFRGSSAQQQGRPRGILLGHRFQQPGYLGL